jgi:hypothetical protein
MQIRLKTHVERNATLESELSEKNSQLRIMESQLREKEQQYQFLTSEYK